MALLLAFVCLWISGGAVLHHTDDDALTVQTFTVGHAALHHAASLPPPASCAACQWEQTLPTLTASAPAVAALPLARVVFAPGLTLALHLRPARPAGRGPPCPLS